MRRDYKLKLRKYSRYFILGVIVAALALGSPVIKAAHLDAKQCPDVIRECPNKMKPYPEDTRICPQIINPCPLEQSEQGTTQ